jgi:hypothetical protein
MINKVKICFIKASFTVMLCLWTPWHQKSLSAAATERNIDINEINNQQKDNRIVEQERNLQQTFGYINHVEFINAISGTVLGRVTNGMTIGLNDYLLSNPNSLNYIAVTSDSVKSVKFTALGNSSLNRIENKLKFALCGKTKYNYWTCKNLKYGQMTLIAQPFSKANAKGLAGNTVTLTFSIATASSTSKSPTSVPNYIIPTPVNSPTLVPSKLPTKTPTRRPTKTPTQRPTVPPKAVMGMQKNNPTRNPTKLPSRSPTKSPNTISSTNPPIPISTTTTNAPAVSSAFDITLSLTSDSQSYSSTFVTAANR